ncbi:MAG: NnrS family protein [Phycisphaeraceae bacterium]|nr:NnrS family protein [Phycisphaeraceae bacterium]
MSQPRPHTAPPGAFIPAPSISARHTAPSGKASWALLHDAFRPFYLGGALLAALAVPLWLGMWYQQAFTPSLPSLSWHMHEMVFGFAGAIIVGFLFTAARNWTGLPLPAGGALALLFALWVGGRVGMYAAYGPATAVLDSSLLVVVAGVLAHKFIRARSLSSMPLVGVLSALATANIAFHAAMHGILAVPPIVPVELGLFLVVLIQMIIGGRVVPGFTANAIPGVRQHRPAPLHRAAFVLAALAFIADIAGLHAVFTASTAMAAAVCIAAQAAGWNPWATRARPMLWILHAAYWFIPIGLGLLGIAAMGLVPRSAAIHALAVGSMGGLIIGMITRTALGHSGRQVRAGWAEVTAFVLILLAAGLRIAASLIPAMSYPAMIAAGSAWALAFIVYLFAYTPLLLDIRSSGKRAGTPHNAPSPTGGQP